MKKSTKLLVGVSALSAAAATVTFAVGEALYIGALTHKGNAFVNKLMSKNDSVKDSFVPDDLFVRGSEWYDGTPRETIHATNSLGETTNAECFIKNEKSCKWAIVCHGYMADPRSMARYAMEYYKRGFNIIMPYMRGHENGVSERVSMGWLDRLDIIGWIEYAIAKTPDAKIVLHGESMGAATVMMTVGEDIPSNVVCAVEDCGYSSVWDEFSYQLPNLFKLPVVPFLFSAQQATKLHTDLDFKKASSVDQLKKSKTPMLFIHGEADDFVPFDMVFKNYDAYSGDKDIYTVPDAKHARSVNVAGDKYWEKVWSFVGKYVDVALENEDA